MSQIECASESQITFKVCIFRPSFWDFWFSRSVLGPQNLYLCEIQVTLMFLITVSYFENHGFHKQHSNIRKVRNWVFVCVCVCVCVCVFNTSNTQISQKSKLDYFFKLETIFSNTWKWNQNIYTITNIGIFINRAACFTDGSIEMLPL